MHNNMHFPERDNRNTAKYSQKGISCKMTKLHICMKMIRPAVLKSWALGTLRAPRQGSKRGL